MINRTESEIKRNWGLGEQPIISCCCMAFNQVSFVGQALDSILMQITDIPFEIIVRDDCSDDGTREVIESYAEKYPTLIVPIYEQENQYSKGVRTLPVVLRKARGKYIAICEGDDYWTDPDKLQRQFRYLQCNPEYSATADNTLVRFESGKEIEFSNRPGRDILLEELVVSRQFSTSSFMFRASNEFSTNLENFLYCDTPLVLFLTKKGKIRYSNCLSSVYRRHSGGVTNQIGTSKDLTERIVEYLHQLNKMLGKEFNNAFDFRISQTYLRYAMNCFPMKPVDFFCYVSRAIKYEPRATSMFLLKKLFLVDKIRDKIMVRSDEQDVFSK